MEITSNLIFFSTILVFLNSNEKKCFSIKVHQCQTQNSYFSAQELFLYSNVRHMKILWNTIILDYVIVHVIVLNFQV